MEAFCNMTTFSSACTVSELNHRRSLMTRLQSFVFFLFFIFFFQSWLDRPLSTHSVSWKICFCCCPHGRRWEVSAAWTLLRVKKKKQSRLWSQEVLLGHFFVWVRGWKLSEIKVLLCWQAIFFGFDKLQLGLFVVDIWLYNNI